MNRRGYEGYRVQPGDGRDKITCKSCGCVIAARGMTRHRKSVIHRQNRRIKALLSKDCLTFLEISHRLKVSFEYVRVLAGRLGYKTGNERKQICTVRRHDEATRKAIERNPLLIALKRISAEKRLRVDSASVKSVKVNDHACLLRKAATVKTFIRIHRPRNLCGASFVLFRMVDGRWLVVPCESLPREQTMFSSRPDPKGRGQVPGNCHNWSRHIDAWHLLKGESLNAER